MNIRFVKSAMSVFDKMPEKLCNFVHFHLMALFFLALLALFLTQWNQKYDNETLEVEP